MKIQRLRAGGVPRALEFCSGCGGLSLGLKSAGFELTAHVEKDADAAATYALNFQPAEAPGAWGSPRDMLACSADQLVADLGLGAPLDSFDLVAAGLPCQAFARIGRSKLRAVSGGENDAFQKDARASLYLRFLEFIADTQPLAILIENVPDILNFGGRNVAEEICTILQGEGYVSSYTILNAAHYGVPQIRDRFFLLAVDAELGIVPDFPEPTHCLDLPRGYEGSRRVALKHVPRDSPYFRPLQVPALGLPQAVGASDALGDLPSIQEHVTDPKVMRRRSVKNRLPYRRLGFLTPFAQRMRSWPDFGTDDSTDGHVVRLTSRDFTTFAEMPHGADYPVALQMAENRLQAELLRAGLAADSRDTPEYAALRKSIVPPYDPKKFPNKWWKLDPLRPSRTLTAHMGKDTYSHIHYDCEQKRMVSVREAARLQSFPDGFRFAGEMNASFRQIGNAVPPLLGHAVARQLQQQLTGAVADFEHRTEEEDA